jgi:threonine/homoserine/homoserine lactone efflux protein
MDVASLWLFLVAATVLALTPGPGIAYVLARTVSGGRKEGIASSVGTGLGGLVHVAASALGLSVLLAESAIAFSIVRYAGACYLVYIGIRLLRTGVRPNGIGAGSAVGCRRAFAEGVLAEALNVKTALFFLAFIPQFVEPSAPAFGQFIMLGCTCVALNTLVDVVVVIAASRIASRVALPAGRIPKALRVASASTLIGLGVYVATTDIRH